MRRLEAEVHVVSGSVAAIRIGSGGWGSGEYSDGVSANGEGLESVVSVWMHELHMLRGADSTHTDMTTVALGSLHHVIHNE